MKIIWSGPAWGDVDRLHAFLADRDPDAADAIFDKLANAPETLLEFQRRGSRLTQYAPREVRELRVASYLLRYELSTSEIRVLRFFHAREDR